MAKSNSFEKMSNQFIHYFIDEMRHQDRMQKMNASLNSNNEAMRNYIDAKIQMQNKYIMENLVYQLENRITSRVLDNINIQVENKSLSAIEEIRKALQNLV